MVDTQVRDSQTARRLFVASALMLFTEIALIRWLGENVLYLSFFTNLILLASFLGIGIGFVRGSQDLGWFRWSAHLLLLLVGFVTVFPIAIDRTAEEVLFLGSGETRGLPIWVALPVVFILAAVVMGAIAHGVARIFRQLKPLRAYRADIAGSVAGVVLFTLVSFVNAPPLVWGVLFGLVFLWVLGSDRRGTHYVAVAGLAVILGLQTFNPFLDWSPYYQLTTAELENVTSLSVNKIPHQAIAPVEYLDEIGWVGSKTFDQLDIDTPENVLIIGAGTGNDVALALDVGAKHIDAVEIDPVIFEKGRQLHPDRPYDATEVVDVHIDDGRAFIERSDDQYDLILLALTDSLTVVAGQSSLRLESFLFTEESIEAAKRLLTPDGMLVSYNLHSDFWVWEKMGRTLQEVFDQEPCFRSEPSPAGTTLAVGALPDSCNGMQRSFLDGPEVATDDYPFLYVRERGIPSFYLTAILVVLAISIVAVRFGVGRVRTLRPYGDLFFMGAAFLLLETKGIVQFALWFGTTWVVNAIVFISILVSVLIAIEVVERFEVPSFKTLYAILAVSLVVAWALPASSLLALPLVPRLLAAALVTFTPVFIANVIFAERFKATASSTAAFGANLLGAMVGGILEYASLAIGYQNLMVLVAILYGVAFVMLRRIDAPQPKVLVKT